MERKIVTVNRKLYHNYDIIECYEVGIVLKGCEVKSIREGKIDIKDAFAVIKDGELWLIEAKISEYAKASYVKVPINRERKLLLHKNELKRIISKISQKGFLLKPTKVYFNKRGLVKIELALCKYKKVYDRREEIKKRELKKELEGFKKYRYN
ncbi:MAG: SsrA-binding protein SmpB [Endomicrobia bacterium]|nr:SsrA-binding protein SmpB [Endomicrobiia bacterium]